MASILGPTQEDVVAWEHKKPKAMYRGSCYPTANPDADDARGYLFLRGAVCTAATSTGVDRSMFDVGACVSSWIGECAPLQVMRAPIHVMQAPPSIQSMCRMSIPHTAPGSFMGSCARRARLATPASPPTACRARSRRRTSTRCVRAVTL